ncbi:hypothetical protein [Myxococcus faecalis]|uniref:hypothetical protein n=1 Tax=Myxococcus faecalis TaxID=3115646 RepID=UPI003CF5F9C9
MSNDGIVKNDGAKQPPPEPLAALHALLASIEHHGIPESWPDDFFEQAQLAALHQEEDATEGDGEDDAIIAAAREMYGSTEIEFDSVPKVSIGEDGAFVSAWVFVPRSSLK